MSSFDSSSMFPINNSLGCEVLKMDDNTNTSLYVPVFPPNMSFMSSTLDRGQTVKFEPKHLKYYIENCMRLGKVRRIDFATREVPNFSTPQTCAFVHFDCLFDNANTKELIASLIGGIQTTHHPIGSFRSFGFHTENGDFCYLTKRGNINVRRIDFTSRSEAFESNVRECGGAHLLFKLNHKPISANDESTRNIEQVLAENKLLIEKLQQKEEEIRMMRMEKSTTDMKVDNLMTQLNQLSGSMDVLTQMAYP
tara:strand:- start:5 stop:760 length:756 start_codon:yes stop_codon:yes gene_type:complete